MFGPAAVLDDYRSATEASGLQNFLQWIPNPYVFERENSDRNAPIPRNRYQIVSLAEALSWSIPDANRGMSTNSPGTGPLDGASAPLVFFSSRPKLSFCDTFRYTDYGVPRAQQTAERLRRCATV